MSQDRPKLDLTIPFSDRNKASNVSDAVRKLKSLKERKQSLEGQKRKLEEKLEKVKEKIEGIKNQESEYPVIALRNDFMEKAGHSFLKNKEGGFDCLCGICKQQDKKQLVVLEEVFEEFGIKLDAFIDRWNEVRGIQQTTKQATFSVNNGSLEVEGCGKAADVFEVAASLLD